MSNRSFTLDTIPGPVELLLNVLICKNSYLTSHFFYHTTLLFASSLFEAITESTSQQCDWTLPVFDSETTVRISGKEQSSGDAPLFAICLRFPSTQSISALSICNYNASADDRDCGVTYESISLSNDCPFFFRT